MKPKHLLNIVFKREKVNQDQQIAVLRGGKVVFEDKIQHIEDRVKKTKQKVVSLLWDLRWDSDDIMNGSSYFDDLVIDELNVKESLMFIQSNIGLKVHKPDWDDGLIINEMTLEIVMLSDAGLKWCNKVSDFITYSKNHRGSRIPLVDLLEKFSERISIRHKEL